MPIIRPLVYSNFPIQKVVCVNSDTWPAQISMQPEREKMSTQFKKKPVIVTAITFDQLVAFGLEQTRDLNAGIPLAFTYCGHNIMQENKDCYLIQTLEGTMRMSRDDMLITGVKGEIYPCKIDIFEATYEQEPLQNEKLSPYQQSVVAEKSELDDRIKKLEAFAYGPSNATLNSLPWPERLRQIEQLTLMCKLSDVLSARIAAF